MVPKGLNVLYAPPSLTVQKQHWKLDMYEDSQRRRMRLVRNYAGTYVSFSGVVPLSHFSFWDVSPLLLWRI